MLWMGRERTTLAWVVLFLFIFGCKQETILRQTENVVVKKQVRGYNIKQQIGIFLKNYIVY